MTKGLSLSLYAFHQEYNDTGRLFFNEYSIDNDRWWAAELVPGVSLIENPAPIFFKNKIYVFYTDKNNRLSVVSWNSEKWSPSNMSPNSYSTCAPAVCEFDNKIYIFHRGYGDNHLWLQTYDGDNWGEDTKLHGQLENSPSSLVFRKIAFVKYKGSGSTTEMYVSVSDDHFSSDVVVNNNNRTSFGPSLMLDPIENKMHCFFQGSTSDGSVWHSTSTDGIHWNDATQILNSHSMSRGLGSIYFNTTFALLLHEGSHLDGNLYASKFDLDSYKVTSTKLIGKTSYHASPVIAWPV